MTGFELLKQCAPLCNQCISAEEAQAVAPVFKALGDPTRLRLYSMIACCDEVCVCDLSPDFDMSLPTLSHHLKVLREAGLVSSERRGTWVYYKQTPAAAHQLAALLQPAGESPCCAT